MKIPQILDCTLRDGGYYNNWDFLESDVQAYMLAMEKLPVTTLEVGYRNIKQKGYLGTYFYCPEFILAKLKQWAPSKQLAIMLNEKDCLPGDLDLLLNPCKQYIDIVRLAVAPNRFDEALELADAIKQRGFKVAFNLMYMSSLVEDPAVLEKITGIEKKIDYFNLVDSYGGVYPHDVAKIVTACKQQTNVALGFHGHNNLELSFANSLAAINAGCDLLDSTLCGMGRGAGNTKTELLLTHFASKEKWTVDFDALSSVVADWEILLEKYQWGTNLPYMVSGGNSLPQKDVMDWVTTRFYSINSIIRALNNQTTGQKDNLKLPVFESEKRFKNAILIGGGPNGLLHAEAVKKFAATLPDTCIIHASSKLAREYKDLHLPKFFCMVGNEGVRLEKNFSNLELPDSSFILPPYPRKMGTYVPDKILKNTVELSTIDVSDKYTDSVTCMALQIAKNLRVENIYIVGYDGYADHAISSKEQTLIAENNYLFETGEDAFVSVTSITPSNYSFKSEMSVYSFLS